MNDCLILTHIDNIRSLMPRLGTRKLQYMLQEQGVKVSRDKLFDLLREHRMLVRRRKKYAITTNSRHWMKKYPNLIRGFSFQRPNQLWVSDITYISINDSFAYLSLVTDAFSRKILGDYLSLNLAADGTAQALKMALADAGSDLSGLIHHSDRGTQYCCKEYVELLLSANIRISMTENGDPYENALAERVNGILKSEWLDHERFDSFEQAKNRIDQIVAIYNNRRPHFSCNLKTPVQQHELQSETKIIQNKTTPLSKTLLALSTNSRTKF